MTVMAAESNRAPKTKEDSRCADEEHAHKEDCVPQNAEKRPSEVSAAESGTGSVNTIQTVDEFKALMYSMQSVRRQIVAAILSNNELENEWIETLNRTYAKLTDSNTKAFQREMSTISAKLSINIKDETTGLMKDLLYLDRLKAARSENRSDSWPETLAKVDLISILAPYHPTSEQKFLEEFEGCLRFLRSFAESNTNGRKPIFITDWDGTMKDYCSQYATNLQPVYSAVGMTRFASRFTRLSAVLTAGPLRGPGILDLTAMPIDGPVLFSGSWGREWWLGGRRVVHEDGISDEGFDALQRLNDEMSNLLHTGDYSQFALVGSGVQRKVDRLTLGVQTVYGHVLPELSHRYQDAVKERMHRVDPQNHILVFDPSTELEVEVVAHNSGVVWNKADGVDRVVSTVGDSLETPGKVLVCGDTHSDLPMVRQAVARNPEGVMALFVGLNEKLRESVRHLVGDQSRCCFVSCPDVIHAAMAELLNQKRSTE
ncbi:Trehalose-phosphatase [Toxocara canis]|nr:Trehalose-phosphatase [Toxocara canis]